MNLKSEDMPSEHDELIDHCDLLEAELKTAKLEIAELKAAAAQQMAPLLNLGGHNVLELNKRLRTQLEGTKAKHENNIAELHACRFESEKIILAANKELETKVEMLTARLAEIAPGPDGNLSLIIHGPRKTPLAEQQQDAAEPPEPAVESQDGGVSDEMNEMTLLIQVDVEHVNEKMTENEKKIAENEKKMAENEKKMAEMDPVRFAAEQQESPPPAVESQDAEVYVRGMSEEYVLAVTFENENQKETNKVTVDAVEYDDLEDRNDHKEQLAAWITEKCCVVATLDWNVADTVEIKWEVGSRRRRAAVVTTESSQETTESSQESQLPGVARRNHRACR